MLNEVGLIAAFTGGLISFFSPCILPIIPGYLSFVAGGTPEHQASRWRIFLSTVFFVIGFAIVFTLLGVFLGSISKIFLNIRDWMNWIGGTLIIIFGLFTMKLIDIPFLSGDHRVSGPKFQSKNIFTSFIFGAVFAVAWSPCVSAILASILVLAATTGSEAQGALLLLSFSIGLGIPFLLTGLFLEQARKLIRVTGPLLGWVNTLAGLLLIALGVLVFTNKLSLVIQVFL